MTVFDLACGAALLVGIAAAVVAGDDVSGARAPIENRPYDLYVRRGDTIVEAPPELLKLARSYATFADKGKFVNGRRITVLAEKLTVKVGERVRLVHVLEAVADGVELYVMGPKPVYDEFVDGKNARPQPVEGPGVYNGRVIRGPAADFHYDTTSYSFATPGRHTIQWKGGGDPLEGNLGLRSNIVTIFVVE